MRYKICPFYFSAIAFRRLRTEIARSTKNEKFMSSVADFQSEVYMFLAKWT